jgi:hypothetical protein
LKRGSGVAQREQIYLDRRFSLGDGDGCISLLRKNIGEHLFDGRLRFHE